MRHRLDPARSLDGWGTVLPHWRKAALLGVIVIIIARVVLLVVDLQATREVQSFVSAINAIPLRTEARFVGASGACRLVAFPDRPARLTGVEFLQSRRKQTGTWIDEPLNLFDAGVPFSARLSYTATRDDDLQNVGALPSLQFVTLDSTDITDAGLGQLRRLPNLTFLSVGDTAVTDRGVETIAEMQALTNLDLQGTAVTNDGLAHLAKLDNLETLNIADTSIVGNGLALLAAIGELTGLDVSGLRIGDADIGYLCRIRGLRRLNLSRTQITDHGLVQLAGLDSLRELRVSETRITAAGLARLRSSAPVIDVFTDPEQLPHTTHW